MPLLPIELAIKAVLIAAGTAAVLRILSVKTAAARHAAWAGVMLVMLLLPLCALWGPKVSVRLLPALPEHTATPAVATAEASPYLTHAETPALPRPQPRWNWITGLLAVYLVGVAVFLTRLTLGTLQARGLVRQALRRDGKLFSGVCGVPITVGWLRPVMVLPANWPEWPAEQLDAVLMHEREHARRRDPLFQWLALLNRAVFWFHPLSWWLEKRIAALAEEACDAAVLAHGHDPRDYSRYLIEMARSVSRRGVRIQVWGMAMAGGSLEGRIRRILEGGPLPQVSRPRLAIAFMACAATSGAFATGALDRQRPARQAERTAPPAQFQSASPNPAPANPARRPLLAQIQRQTTTGMSIADAPGVNVSGADRLLHRDALEYPAEARAKGIEGVVVLDLTLAPDGTLADAAVISGPLELRGSALSSILKWHFSKEAATRQQVTVQFSLPARGPAGAFPAGPIQDLSTPETLTMLSIRGLPTEAAEGLRRKLQLQEGQLIDRAALERARSVALEFNNRLSVTLARTMAEANPGEARKSGVALMIALPPAVAGYNLTDVPRRLHVDIQGLPPEAAAELRQRLALREGEILDHAAVVKELERIHQIVHEFDPHLSDSRATARAPRRDAGGALIPPDVIDMTLIISPGASDSPLVQYSRIGRPQGDPLENFPIKLHIDIQGLAPEATAELRRRLAVREGETLDSAAFKATLTRLRQVIKEFDPRLTDEVNFDFPPRKFAADGRPIPWDSADATVVIKAH